MCSSIVDTIKAQKRGTLFSVQDMHEGNLPENVTLHDIDKEIYVTDSEGTIYKNADAVLKIADEYFSTLYFTKLGRVPLIKQILTFGYTIVAKNRHFFTGDMSTLFLMKITVVLGSILGFLMSSKLWLSERLYPLLPVYSHPPTTSSPFDYLIYCSLLVFLVSILISPRPQKIIWSFIGTVFLVITLDQSRMQPWVIQYLFILGTLSLFSWRKNDIDGTTNSITTLQIIIASTYFFSGLQKINMTFITGVMPWMLQPVTSLIPQMTLYAPLLGLCAPFVQIFFAIGLLTQKYRRISLILAVSMHVFILILLGPFGYNWNSIIWPWTIAMALFDIILFKNTNEINFKKLFFEINNKVQKIILLFFIILPFLSFFNVWDSYLSSALYSGNTTEGIISISETSKNLLPKKIQTYLFPTLNQKVYSLDPTEWSIDELNVPPYPEERIYKNLLKTICVWTNNSSSTYLHIKERRLFNSTPEKIYGCTYLLPSKL